MISKRFSTSKKASKFSKRVLGMESLENRELLSINPLGYDGSDVVQTAATFSTESAEFFSTESDFTTEDAPAVVTNSIATASGVTTSAATFTWTKPTKVTGSTSTISKIGDYTVTIHLKSDDSLVDTISGDTLKTKTTWTQTSKLTAGTEYYYVVKANLTMKDETTSDGAVIAVGEFEMEAEGTAADVAIGPATDVKTAYSKASGAKAASVKVTWKAPANYTGSYTVTLKTGTSADVTYTVNPGAKLEAVFNVATTQVDGEKGTLADKSVYSVVIETDGSIASTTTYVTVGDAPSSAVAPAAATSVAGTALADVPGGTTVKVVAGTDTANAVAGYWIGLYADGTKAAAAKLGDLNLKYIAADAAVATGVNFTGATGKFAAAIAVGADGTPSAVKAADAAVTAEADATLDDKVTAAKTVKGVLKTGTTNTYTVTWAANIADISSTEPTKADLVSYKIENWYVKYSSDGGTTWLYAGTVVGTAAASALTLDVPVNPGKSYIFAVEATYNTQTSIVDPDNEGKFKWDAITTTATMSKEAKSTAVSVAAEKITAPVKATEPVKDNKGTSFTVNWTKPVTGTATGYKVTLLDANKAVLGTFTVADSITSLTFVKAASPANPGELAFDLTPGAKYTVTVQATGAIPGTVSPALSIAVTSTAYPAATAKVDSKKITLLGASVTVTPGKNADATNLHYLEITSTVDAKGKPDWNAGWYQLVGDDGIVTAAKEVAITAQLKPSTQYFVRVVAVDVAPTSTTDWSNITKVATGKEAKFKTVAAPVAAIGKSGFGMSAAYDFGFKFDFKDPSVADKKDILVIDSTDSTFTYELFVADDKAKADKVTGLLGGAKSLGEITAAMLEPMTDKEGKVIDGQFKLKDVIKLEDVATALGNDLTGLKSLQFQLKVTYSNAKTDNGNGAGDATTEVYATLYTKAAKLALPKWYV